MKTMRGEFFLGVADPPRRLFIVEIVKLAFVGGIDPRDNFLPGRLALPLAR